MKAAESATILWDTLWRHPGGLTSKMVCHHSGLTSSQVRKALDYTRDLFEDDPETPIIQIWEKGTGWLYKFGTDERDAREHFERKLRGQITRARREHNDWHKLALRHPTVENERQEELARRRLLDLRYAHDLINKGHAQEALSA